MDLQKILVMVQLKVLLVFLSVVVLDIGRGPVHLGKNHSMSFLKREGTDALLVYTGNLAGTKISLSMKIRIEVKPSTGIRCEMTSNMGTRILGHTIVFYKFSNPNKTILYDCIHNVYSIHGKTPRHVKELNVVVIGKDFVGGFKCTHLQHITKSPDSKTDYYMSPEVGSFLEFIDVLKANNLGLFSGLMNETIFHYGGLVRMTGTISSESGESANATLNLVEENNDFDFPVNDFELPVSAKEDKESD